MHYKTLVFAGLLGLSAAAPTEKRQVGAIVGAFNTIQTPLTALGQGVQGFTGGSITGLQNQALALQNGIVSATGAINGAQIIAAAEVAQVQTALGTLTTGLQGIFTNLINNKAVFQQAGLGSVLLSGLQQQQQVGLAFIQALTAKLPQGNQGIIQTFGTNIGNSLNQVITAYGGTVGGAGVGGAGVGAGVGGAGVGGAGVGGAGVGGAGVGGAGLNRAGFGGFGGFGRGFGFAA